MDCLHKLEFVNDPPAMFNKKWVLVWTKYHIVSMFLILLVAHSKFVKQFSFLSHVIGPAKSTNN